MCDIDNINKLEHFVEIIKLECEFKGNIFDSTLINNQNLGLINLSDINNKSIGLLTNQCK